MSAAVKKRAASPRVEVAPGYVVINISGASGGVTYTRQAVNTKTKRHAKSTTFMNVMHVDHEALVSEINAVVKKVDDTVLRSRCVKTSFGHFVAERDVGGLRADVAELRARVDALNIAAAGAKSKHRGRVGVVIAQLDVRHPDVVGEVSRTIIEILTGLRDALAAGDIDDVTDKTGKVVHRNAMKPLLIRAKNIESMVTGTSATVLHAALDRVRTARAEVRERTGEVDFSAIDVAIGWFS
jgi:hypothetical protein